jgi:hypothetical protein
MTDLIKRHGWHWSFGILRRPEMDLTKPVVAYCYENPDGDLIYSQRKEHKYQMYMDSRVDEDTGEEYSCLAPIPRRQSYKRRTVK